MPFTAQQFMELFAEYNTSVWPAQAGLILLALLAVASLFIEFPKRDQLISGTLAFFWAWMAIAYHFVFFTRINNAAWLFGSVFILEALLLVWVGIIKQSLHFHSSNNLAAKLGLLLIAYALVLYPALNLTLGHTYPTMPTFGLPCPVTIFTLGLLLNTTPLAAKLLLVIPLLWAVIGSSAAYLLGIVEDLGLMLAGLLCLYLFVTQSSSRDDIHRNLTKPE